MVRIFVNRLGRGKGVATNGLQRQELPTERVLSTFELDLELAHNV